MLYLIGLGMGDENDISLKGLEACRKADAVFAELYTARWQGSLKNLEKMIERKITVLERKDLEENSENFVKNASKKDTVLLVPGDPLTATTHINLLMDAGKHGVAFRVIHASSILTAIAETGLNLYNFGRTATVVKPRKNYSPTSFYDIGAQNKKAGMHTLFLLDIDMWASEGLTILLNIEKRKKGGLLKPESKVIAASGIGLKYSKIEYGKVKALLKRPLKPPAVVIIPGKLHFVEKEWLESL
jgi:diphthine synthase